MQSYSVLLILKREALKQLYNTVQMQHIQQLFEECLFINNENVTGKCLVNYSQSLISHSSDVMFLNPQYKSNYFLKRLKEMDKKFAHYRRRFDRHYGLKTKMSKELIANRVCVGVQTE
jgi:hypothetical protein